MHRVIQQFLIIATAFSLSNATAVTVTANVDNVISQSTHVRRRETNDSRQLESIERVDFILYNAENNQFLTPLGDNSWMSITQWGVTDPSSLNIECRVNGSPTAVASVASVQFNLDDGLLDRADGGPAKFMCGNGGENVYKCPQLKFGKHKLVATLYSGPNGSGTNMGTYSINFEFLGGGSDPAPLPVPVPEPVQAPIPAPVDAPVAFDTPDTVLPSSDFVFTLLNADKDVSIVTIEDGMTINLAKYNQNEDTPLAIEAAYTKSSDVGVKKFNLNNGQYIKVDGGARTFMCGNFGTDYFGCPDLKVNGGTYTLETTNYAFGKAVGTTKITFNLVYSKDPVTNPVTSTTSECAVPKFVGEFERVASFPIELAESMGAMIGDDFVIVSGFDDGFHGVTKRVLALKTTDPTATWRDMDPVPTDDGFSHSAYSVKDNVMYACGAYVGPSPGPDSPICLKYDHAAEKGKQWSFLPNLPDGRGGGALHYMEETNSLMFSTGAVRRNGDWVDKDNVWELSLNDISAGWKDLPPIPYTGNHIGHVKATFNGKKRYYTIGGQRTFDEAHGNKVDNYEWDNIGRKWIKHADMPFPRGHISSSTVPYGCGFFIAGGAINDDKRTADVTYYGIDTDSYTSIGNLPRTVNTPICDMVYLPTGNYLYCVTGPFSKEFSWRIRIE